DADGLANRLRCHGVVITPEARERNINGASSPDPCPGRGAARSDATRSRGPSICWYPAAWVPARRRSVTGRCFASPRLHLVRETRVSYPPIFATSASEISKLA